MFQSPFYSIILASDEANNILNYALIIHDRVYDLKKYDDSCLKPAHHMVCRVYHRMASEGTILCHKECFQLCVSYPCCIEHDTLSQYNSVGWPVSYTCLDQYHNFYGMVQRSVFEIPFQDLCLIISLRCALPPMFHNLQHQEVARLSSTFLKNVFQLRLDHQQYISHVLVLVHLGQYQQFIHVTTQTVRITH